ncbi:hypothetical protein OKW28_007642 [Paraburkholderia sp. 40]
MMSGNVIEGLVPLPRAVPRLFFSVRKRTGARVSWLTTIDRCNMSSQDGMPGTYEWRRTVVDFCQSVL